MPPRDLWFTSSDTHQMVEMQLGTCLNMDTLLKSDKIISTVHAHILGVVRCKYLIKSHNM